MSRIWVRTARVAAVAAGLTMCVTALPSAAAAPAYDSQGYVDSTARCAASDTAVLFGSTDTSRVAICKDSGGQYEYRGVRVRDGAKLILPASAYGNGAYDAESDGITYLVDAKSLTVNSGGKTIRSESWLDFHGPKSPASGTSSPSTSSPSTSGSATPTTSAKPTSTTPTSTTPLPPPLPAEVGGSR
ncbi:hypothetical protein [Mycobacterium sp. M26]|uniref:hypothetical protein n=1 Tax=Mycobacterium sp. M26 TaxID=1762962 RepID=UPI00073EFE7A|nr:hypothetical protein [Mycobacterium sp. M26]